MKLILITITISLLSTTLAFSQEHIWTKQTRLSEVIKFEKEINSSLKYLTQNVSLSADYYPLAEKYKVTNPLIVVRPAIKYLPIYAEYFYTPQDSVIRLVSYDWEKDRYGNFFNKQKLWKEESTKLTLYVSEYERIKADLLSQLGSPTLSDPIIREESSDGKKYYSKETSWDNAVFKATLNMIFASATYRIRLTLYWKE